ncbi:MAG: TRAP transporter small permease [Syntrophales bacterium]|nr:TRAP transporter small permease [Syntrophales bacterium]
MMIITCADVLLRLFNRPIPGAYELAGFAGAFMASFSLSYTSIEKGHITVEIFVSRLPQRLQIFLEGINALLSTVLFTLLAKECFIYAMELKNSQEVSLTLGIPISPMVFGIAAGFAMTTLVFLQESLRSFRRLLK